MYSPHIDSINFGIYIYLCQFFFIVTVSSSIFFIVIENVHSSKNETLLRRRYDVDNNGVRLLTGMCWLWFIFLFASYVKTTHFTKIHVIMSNDLQIVLASLAYVLLVLLSHFPFFYSYQKNISLLLCLNFKYKFLINVE